MFLSSLATALLVLLPSLSPPPSTDVEEWSYLRAEGAPYPSFKMEYHQIGFSPKSGAVCLWHDGEIQVLDPHDLSVRASIPHENNVGCIAVDAEDRLVAADRESGILTAYDLKTKEKLWSSQVAGGERWCTKIDFSPDGKMVAAVGTKGASVLSISGDLIGSLGRNIRSVQFSPDSKFIALNDSLYQLSEGLNGKALPFPKGQSAHHVYRIEGRDHYTMVGLDGVYEVNLKRQKWKRLIKIKDFKRYSGRTPQPIRNGLMWTGWENQRAYIYRAMGERRLKLTRFERGVFNSDLGGGAPFFPPSGDCIYVYHGKRREPVGTLVRYPLVEPEAGWLQFCRHLGWIRWSESGVASSSFCHFDPETRLAEEIFRPHPRYVITHRWHVALSKNDNYVDIFDRETGEERRIKRPKLDSGSHVKRGSISPNGRYVVLKERPESALVDTKTKKVIRKWQGGSREPHLVGDDGTLYEARGGKHLLALDPEGTRLWSREAVGPFLLSPESTRIAGLGILIDATSGDVVATWDEDKPAEKSPYLRGTAIVPPRRLPVSDDEFVVWIPKDADTGKPSMLLEFRDWKTGEVKRRASLPDLTEVYSVSPDREFIIGRTTLSPAVLLRRPPTEE